MYLNLHIHVHCILAVTKVTILKDDYVMQSVCYINKKFQTYNNLSHHMNNHGYSGRLVAPMALWALFFKASHTSNAVTVNTVTALLHTWKPMTLFPLTSKLNIPINL
ncbi:hypothetical protein OTU49_002526 [Cherax quadricarinatus]|uniref:Uncharacterized protein n=1 Tax=Cherax quadricarinatus TaxID=27406 RepID=A0AAW0XNF1_CHEQU